MRRRTGYLIRRGKIFYAVWTVGGKKLMRSTGEKDRRKAEKELHRIMEPFIAGDEIVTLRNIAAQIEGRTAELIKTEDKLNPPLTISAAWNSYISAPGRPDSGPVTLAHYEGHFLAFAKWLKHTHSDVLALRDVTPVIVGEYAVHLSKERSLSANRFNKHIRFLELMFRVLKAPARLTVNPWEEIHRKRVISDSRRELTMDELRTVYTAASGEMRLLLAIGIYTGLRLGDVATLRWAEVDLRRRLIRRIPGKVARRNPRPVIIPIHATLATLLMDIPAGNRDEYVTPETAALYLRDTAALSKKIQEHFETCKVKTHRKGTGEGSNKRAVVEVGFHSLRHTFVSLCRESNAPLAVVEAIVGHSNPAMTRHYTHIGEAAAGTAIAALPNVIGRKTTSSKLITHHLVDAGSILKVVQKLNTKNGLKIKKELFALLNEK